MPMTSQWFAVWETNDDDQNAVPSLHWTLHLPHTGLYLDVQVIIIMITKIHHYDDDDHRHYNVHHQRGWDSGVS